MHSQHALQKYIESRSPILVNTNKIIGRVQNYEFALRGQRKCECKNRIIGEKRDGIKIHNRGLCALLRYSSRLVRG